MPETRKPRPPPLSVRLPAGELERLNERAAALGMNRNAFIVVALSSARLTSVAQEKRAARLLAAVQTLNDVLTDAGLLDESGDSPRINALRESIELLRAGLLDIAGRRP